jgi:hypothetical protein
VLAQELMTEEEMTGAEVKDLLARTRAKIVKREVPLAPRPPSV